MKPPSFEYLAPESVAAVVEALESLGDDAKLLAGGQSLIPLLNLRLSAPSALIDLRRVPELRGASVLGGFLDVGAMTPHAELLADERVRSGIPVLAEALRWVAHPAIRNAGTVGGSIAHADPAAELPALLLLLEGEAVVAGPRGQRVVPAADFFVTYFTTAVESDEVLTRVRWPLAQASPLLARGWSFKEIARRHGDFCIISAGAMLTLDRDGRVGEARLVLGGVADRPLRLPEVEALLVGRVPDEPLLRELGAAAAGAVNPSGDIHASADYRRHLTHTLTVQALGESLARAKEEMV